MERWRDGGIRDGRVVANIAKAHAIGAAGMQHAALRRCFNLGGQFGVVDLTDS